MRALIAVALLAACGDNLYRAEPFVSEGGSNVVGAFEIDHLAADDPGLLRAIDYARSAHVVTMLYGHDPPHGTSYATLDAVLSRADADGLPTLTFADLVAHGPGSGGLCISFDDKDVDDWYLLRDLLAAHHAHISFFVTEYASFTDEMRQKLHVLAADGNSMEAHGVAHLNAVDYVAAHGLPAYIADEVEPSFQILRDDGFAPVAFAYPYGARDPQIDDALAARYALVRAISGHPKE